MATQLKFGGEYRTMLQTPVPLKGPRKNAIDVLEKQIEFHLGEINKLRLAQNSHVPISGLPAELLTEAFLYVVESNSHEDIAHFTPGTFNFRQVCKHWNEVAIGFPQLWVRWMSGAVKAWPLFDTRSGDAPVFLTWRGTKPSHSFRSAFENPALPAKIRQLDFSGSSEELEHLLSAFNLNPPLNVSSVRFRVLSYFTFESDTRDHFARFIPFSFPKLSKLDVEHCQPDISSPIFTTSNLTSLKLCFHHGTGLPGYTLTQFSQILQRHPNLRELDLKHGAIPLVDSPEAPVPIALPRLVDLKLCGMAECVLGLINVIGMPSPLRNVELRFRDPRHPEAPAIINAVKKILAAYYEFERPDYPRKVNHLRIVSWPRVDYDPLCFIAQSRPSPTSTPQSVLKLEVNGTDELLELLNLLPLNDIQEFVADGLNFPSNKYRMLLQRMKDLPRLQLAALDITPVMEAMRFCGQGEPTQQVLPKLAALTLSRLDLLRGAEVHLYSFLEERCDRGMSLKRLVVELCRVRAVEDVSRLVELVEKVEWTGLEEMGMNYEGSESDSDELSEYAQGMYSDFYYFQ